MMGDQSKNNHDSTHLLKQFINKWDHWLEEESLNLINFINNDIQSTAEFIIEAEESIADRYYFDKLAMGERLIKLSAQLADKSIIEYFMFKQDLNHQFNYRTGELGLGMLCCQYCQQVVYLKTLETIPPCAQCHHTDFYRLDKEI